jgi:hypothetical protein
MEKDLVLSLYQKPQTVFSLKEIAMLFPYISYNNLKRRLSYYVSTKKLKKLRKNVYSKIEYNPLEIPQKLYLPSYVSLETVLQKEGIIFQRYESIFSVSHISREITVDNKKIIYRLMPDRILFNRKEIKETDGYFIATKERAFADAVYSYKDYHFDNLEPLDWDKIMSLVNIYENKAFAKRIESYYELSSHRVSYV